MRKVLITGSSQGLGLELARTFNKNDCHIFIHGRSEKRLNDIKGKFEKTSNNSCTIIKGDLLEDSTINRLASVFVSNEIDILINNAGVYIKKPFLDSSIEDFKRIMEINFLANVKLLQKIFPYMVSKKEGLIININSLAGKGGSDGEAAYCASKHAMKGFSESLQFDATKYGIRVIDVFSGAIKTNMSNERSERKKFISPEEASKVIYNITSQYDTLRITQIDLNRLNY